MAVYLFRCLTATKYDNEPGNAEPVTAPIPRARCP